MLDSDGRRFDLSALLLAITELTTAVESGQVRAVDWAGDEMTNLTTALERLQQMLSERQQESRGPSADAERMSRRTAGISGAVQALQQDRDRVAMDIEELRREQAALARALADVESRSDQRDQDQAFVVEALGKVRELERRIEALERGRSATADAEVSARAARPEEQIRAELAAIRSQQARVQAALTELLQRQTAGPTASAEAPTQPARPQHAGIPAANDLNRRLERLERRWETLAHVIELVVEWARVFAQRDIDAGPQPG